MTASQCKISLALLTMMAVTSACSSDSNTEPAAAAAESAEVQAATFPTATLIDPNTATEEVLAAIPGMTAAASQAIVTARPFATPSEMDAAIGDTLDTDARKAVYALVFVKVGLNSGAEDDYKLIPSTLTPRHLAHEFEEYRPYESMEQFSREMSKYVSDAEVAYLERFVTLD